MYMVTSSMNIFLPHFLTLVCILLTYLQGIFLSDRQLSCLSYLHPWFTLITFYWTMYILRSRYIVRKCVVNTSLLPLLHGFTQYLHGRKLIFCPFVGGWPHDLTWLDWRFSKNLTLATVKATGLFCKCFIEIRILRM